MYPLLSMQRVKTSISTGMQSGCSGSFRGSAVYLWSSAQKVLVAVTLDGSSPGLGRVFNDPWFCLHWTGVHRDLAKCSWFLPDFYEFRLLRNSHVISSSTVRHNPSFSVGPA